MGLFSFAFAGVGFILIGTHEALKASQISDPKPTLTPSSSQPNKTQSSSNLFFISLSIFSSFFIFNSLISLLNAHTSNDAVGSALQLQVIPIALIFLLYSVLSLLASLPSQLLGLVGAFAFVEEFLLFYLQRKDPSGIENRYYDLLLVPIAVCVFSTVLELKSPESCVPKLGRGVGLILQGTWFVQMGLSLFSSWVAHGCDLHQVSRGNYTLRCKGHPEYHRARAIATLQFNCHLALMVVVVVGFYSVICGRNGGSLDSSASYKPIGAELQAFENSGNFTLDSDGDDDEEIEDGGNLATQKAIVVEHGMNVIRSDFTTGSIM
ncbi:uncharacterized protein LOC133285641 isoform X2 [Gastrolobium bilobum]|uniref:uncharacterized protein LOC133285641 isoform X2 n=1 Tax=Gastrolobium bilobum TaxID=150636 RepID=UPI002AB24696|nr:uncharacterized protein LOC133285641 isoform X2 [Gastrolobium bilobum]